MMFPRTKKNSLTKKILSVSLIGCITVTITAAAMQPIFVYASLGTSIKSLIVTLIAAIGIGNSNPNFTNALDQSQLLNSSYESLVDESISAAALDQELSNLGVDVTNMTNVLGNSAADAAAVSAQDTTGALGDIGAATAGENIKAAAEHLAETGEVGAAIGGKAVGCLNGTGSLLPIIWNQQIHSENVQKLEKLIANAQNYNNNDFLKRYIRPGINAIFTSNMASGNTFPTSDRYSSYYNAPVGWIFAYSTDGYQGICNTTSTNGQYTNTSGSAMIGSSQYSISAHSYDISSSSTNPKYIAGYTTFTTRTDMQNYFESIKGTDQSDNVHSPDLIGTEGNQKGQWPSQNTFNFPDIKPIVNITNNNPTQYITPIDYDDYKNWQQTANQNTQNGETGEDQGEDFLNLIRDFIRQWDGTIPQPTEAPFPTMAPETIPVQPTEAPKPTNTPEQDQQNVNVMATTGLAEKFPFCIPFDLFSMMSQFTANRSAPYIDVELDLGPAGVHHIELDFSVWDSVAALLRLLELIVFIGGLALVARRMIGAGGD